MQAVTQANAPVLEGVVLQRLAHRDAGNVPLGQVHLVAHREPLLAAALARRELEGLFGEAHEVQVLCLPVERLEGDGDDLVVEREFPEVDRYHRAANEALRVC